MSISVTALENLKRTSLELSSYNIPTDREFPPVKRELQFITELTFIYILKLLGLEDEKKLAEIISHLRQGTPFYDFTYLVHNLAKSKTDFDFLTSPENVSVYKKIIEVSNECNIELLPYVNVLAKIADNKQYGLYTENQEVVFFLEEYGKNKDKVDSKKFLHQFKKILKYETQVIFERFLNEKIFSIIQDVLSKNSAQIQNSQTLVFYTYGLTYYDNKISNQDENFLLEHIKFCVDYLSNHKLLDFNVKSKQRNIPIFNDETQAVNYFFEHNKDVVDSLDKFLALLKDVCPSDDVNDFCDYLRNNLYKSDVVSIDDSKNLFVQAFSENIRSRINNENIKLYKDIFKLLPKKFIRERSPNVLHRKGDTLYIFSLHNINVEKNMFMALESGNIKTQIPPAHTLVEVEILKSDEKGNALQWSWKNL